MRFKVELHKEVGRYIRQECLEPDRREFYAGLERIRTDPIANSEALAETEISRYVLRYFRFGRHIAIFQFDPLRDGVIVQVCRRFRQTRPRKRGPTDTP